jgi:hypothetical protein
MKKQDCCHLGGHGHVGRPAVASAQTVKGVYWTTSGKFGPFPITGLIPTVPKDKQRDITIPVSMWIIDREGPGGIRRREQRRGLRRQLQNYWAAGLCDFLKPSQMPT